MRSSGQGSDKLFDVLYGGPAPEAAKKEKPKKEWYLKLCKTAGKYLGKSAKKELTEDYKVTLAFLGWKVKPQDFNAAPLFVAYLGFVVSFIWVVLNYIMQGSPLQVGVFTLIGYPLELGFSSLIYIAPFFATVFAMYYIQTYPMSRAETEKIRALTYIPEIINYMIMSMKVSPNLERAITFAAEHGHGRIAEDFKNVHWDIQIGKFKTVEEALDHLAWKWGKYSDDFKHALMMIRSSVMEADEGKRDALLDKAVEDALEGIKGKMDMYSRAMHQPSIYLYYLGVLLPLLLIIIIPVGAMMSPDSMGLLSRAEVLFFVYNIVIPGASLLMAKSILQRRPPTREAPHIPDNLPGLPTPGWFKIGKHQLPVLVGCVLIFVGVVLVGFFANQFLHPPPELWETVSYTPVLWFGGLAVGLASAISFYLWAYNKDKRKVQLEIIDMEGQFQDTLYFLASRLGEGKPMEEALHSAAEFMPDSAATKRIFIPTLQNLKLMGMTLKTALFDPAYGSLRYVPSDFIRSTMTIVVDSVQLGVKTAARSLVSLSMQLRNSQRVEKSLKAMLEDITTMVSTMSIFIAPVVLGITTSLQQIITSALSSMSSAGLSDLDLSSAGAAGISLPSMPSLGAGDLPTTEPWQILTIVALYMMEIVIVLTFFAASVNEGKNDLAFKMALAQALPLSMTIFFIVAFVATKFTSVGL